MQKATVKQFKPLKKLVTLGEPMLMFMFCIKFDEIHFNLVLHSINKRKNGNRKTLKAFCLVFVRGLKKVKACIWFQTKLFSVAAFFFQHNEKNPNRIFILNSCSFFLSSFCVYPLKIELREMQFALYDHVKMGLSKLNFSGQSK